MKPGLKLLLLYQLTFGQPGSVYLPLCYHLGTVCRVTVEDPPHKCSACHVSLVLNLHIQFLVSKHSRVAVAVALLLTIYYAVCFALRRVMGVRTCESRCLFSGSKGEVCCIEPLHAKTELRDHPITQYSLLAMASLTKVTSFL